MASTTFPVRVVSVGYSGEQPALYVEPAGEKSICFLGNPDDAKAFAKLYAKRTAQARLVIGGEDGAVDMAAAARITDLEKQLSEKEARIKALEETATVEDAPLGPDHPLARAGRGALIVIREQAQKHVNDPNTKATAAQHWAAIISAASAGLEKIAALVVEPKTNGKAAEQTSAAS